jgi:hypothetical protein
MKVRVNQFEYSTSQEAWEGINEYFLNNEDSIVKKGGVRYGPQLIMNRVFMVIRKSWVDPNFDFGNIFGYRKQKWSSLLNNYVNMNYLDLLKSQIHVKIKKKTPHYNLSMPFTDSHGSGKNCLLSLTISMRANLDHPIITFNLRSSEVTKRLLFDFLLIQRISEYIFGEEQYVSIQLFCDNMYQNTESFTMYDSFKPILGLIQVKGKLTVWQERTIEVLNKFKTCIPETITFKVHRRSVNQLQRGEDGYPLPGNKPLLAKDCKIYSRDFDYPEDCITTSQRRAFRKTINKRYDK